MSDAGFDAGDQDEELPQPRRRLEARRLRLELGLAAVLLLVVAVLARSLTHRGSGTPAATTSAAPSHRVTVQTFPTDFVTLTPIKGGWLPRSAAQALRCPVRCVTIADVSGPVRDAIADAFPGAQVTSARTVRLVVRNFGNANWSLQVRARAGDRLVLLQARGAANGDSGGYQQMIFDGHLISRYAVTLMEYHVLVQVISPADDPPSRAALQQLAGDARLLSTW